MGRATNLGDLQLAVLQVLWRRREATASEVRDALAADRDPAKSTIATVLSRLERQGLVRHRRDDREYVYAPVLSRQQVQGSIVGDLVVRLFGGDPAELVCHLISTRELAAGDLDRLRELIEDADVRHEEDDR